MFGFGKEKKDGGFSVSDEQIHVFVRNNGEEVKFVYLNGSKEERDKAIAKWKEKGYRHEVGFMATSPRGYIRWSAFSGPHYAW